MAKIVDVDKAIQILDAAIDIIDGKHAANQLMLRANKLAVKKTLRDNDSEGPPLSDAWIEEKEESYNNGVQEPPYMTSSSHLNAWTGHMESMIEAWIGPNGEMLVGVRDKSLSHPLKPISALMQALQAEFGSHQLSAYKVPPRPFIGAAITRNRCSVDTCDIIKNTLNNI